VKRLLEVAQPADRMLATLLAETVELVQARTQDPFRKRRIHTRVLRRQRERSRRPVLLLALGLLGISAGASAAVAWGTRASPERSIAQPPAQSSAPTPRPPEDKTMTTNTPPNATAPSSTNATQAPLAPRSEAPRRLGLREPEDPTRVVEAMRALRQEKNPARARALLAEHQALHPRGALSEEVLALSIEAAVAQGDARASDFARRYLSQYPRGRFRGLALRALAHGAR
jgi:hypothetical protein